MDPRIRPHGAAHARHRGQLLSHRAGLPEDNPWGDQELDASEAALNEWLRAGIPFSTAPDTRYEYSSYAFGLLGRIPPALALTSPIFQDVLPPLRHWRTLANSSKACG